MKRLGIAEALVHHQLAAEADVHKGNELLSRLLQGIPNLHPCWVMAPRALGDLPDGTAWVRQAADAGVRAVRVFPRHSLYTLAEWCTGPLTKALEDAGLPLFIDYGPHHWSERVIEWEDLKELCDAQSKLEIVVVGATVGETRDIVALLHRLPNLHIEYHAFAPSDGLERLAAEGLAHKVLFGSGMPARAGECVVMQTLKSGLSAQDQRLVAGDNLRRLLHLAASAKRAPSGEKPKGVYAGPVVDVHGHIGSWERTVTLLRTPEDIVSSMQRCGVHQMVASSFSAIHGEMQLGNEETRQAVQRFPGVLFGYAVMNPHYRNDCKRELKRRFSRDTGFVGLKLHCGLHGVQLQDSGYAYALGFANEHGLPVLVHGGGHDKWTEIAARYPHAAFIMAHACAWNGWDPQGAELYRPVRDTANLYVDVAGSAAHRGALRALVDLVGAKKVLHGSDCPMFDLAFELGRIALSDLSSKEKRTICVRNALRIFKSLA
jgi:hypothetical protein